MIIFAQTLKNMTLILTIILAFLQALPFGSNPKPVVSSHHMEQLAADTVRLAFDLTISDGWHVYSTNLPAGGPISAELNLDSFSGLIPVSALLFNGDEIEMDDPVFGMRVRYFAKKVTFYKNFKITRDEWFIEGALTYGACNDESCLPPQRIEFSHANTPAAAPAAYENEDGIDEIEGFDNLLWAPLTYTDANAVTGGGSLWGHRQQHHHPEQRHRLRHRDRH